MQPRSLHWIAAKCSGRLAQGEGSLIVERACTDTRQLRPGDLFLAIRGERFDGHAFLQEAHERGVVAVLAEESSLPAVLPPCPVLCVRDTRVALGAIAAAVRAECLLHMVAVVGSNGKTTTKDLIGSILAQRFVTVTSEASFNNEIGVPLTLLRLEKSTQAAVLEVGTNHPGELGPLLSMIQPGFGVLTSIGREHLEHFVDLDGVIREEGTIGPALGEGGTLFMAGGEPWSQEIAGRCRGRKVFAGWGKENDWRISSMGHGSSGTWFRVDSEQCEYRGEYQLNLLGRHQVQLGVLAVAVGAELGLTSAEIRAGLLACPAPKRRLQLHQCGGLRIVDDCYNANPDSVAAALATLREVSNNGRRVVVLGDMGELGSSSQAAHEEVGRSVAASGVDCFFAVGEMSSVLAGAARAAGQRAVHEFTDAASAAEAVKRVLRPGDWVLVKASRACRLETVVETLRTVRMPEKEPPPGMLAA